MAPTAPTDSGRSGQAILGAFARAAFAVALIAAVLLGTLLAPPLAGATVPTPPAGPTAPRPDATPGPLADRAVRLAEGSLALGAGPADGRPFACRASGGSAACGPALGANASAPEWVPAARVTSPFLSGRDFAALAYDPVAAVTVLFGGYDPSVAADGDTWTYANGTWSDLTASLSTAPPARWGAGMTWDAADGYLLLFGGRNDTAFFNDTWAFNGSAWRLIASASAPSPREYPALADDPLDGYVVATGGGIGNLPAGSSSPWTFYADTWTFAGGTWTNVTTGAGAPGLLLSAAYDPAAHEVVGVGVPLPADTAPTCSPAAYTWTFANGTWSNLSAATNLTTPAVWAAGLAYDPDLASGVLFGGKVAAGTGCGSTDATWTFSGGRWSNLTSALPVSPLGREGASAAFDPGADAFLLFGGTVDALGEYLNDTWALVANATGAVPSVTASASATSGPAPLTVRLSATVANGTAPFFAVWSFGDGSAPAGAFGVNHTYAAAGAYTASVTVVDGFGLFATASIPVSVLGGSTGGGNGSGWVNLTPTLLAAPAPRDMAAMAYDPAVGAVVLFGGYSPYVYPYGDTWLFSNGSWRDISSLLLNSPSARWGDRMVWDPGDGYLLLFGGRNLTQFFNDTWRFTGATWSVLPTPHAPSPRAFYELSDDPADGVVLLYGGGIGNLPAGSDSPWTVFADTWSFAGGQWTNLTGSVRGAPGPREAAGMAFDPAGGSVLLYGGTAYGHPAGPCLPLPYAYAYRNGTWSNVSGAPGAPPALASLAMVTSAVDGAVLLFGGTTPSGSWCASTAGTYEYANGSWTNLTSTVSPSARDEAAAAYDASANETILFGGNTEGIATAGGYYADTWAFLPPSPGGRSGGGTGGLPLTLAASASLARGAAPLAVEFSGVATGGTAPYRFAWTFGDGGDAVSTGPTEHVYGSAGTYAPSVTVTDATGRQATVDLPWVEVAAAPNGPTPATKALSPGVPWDLLFLFGGAGAGGVITAGLLGWRRRRELDRDEGTALVRSLREPPSEPGTGALPSSDGEGE